MFTEDVSAFFQRADFSPGAVYNGTTAIEGHFDNADLGMLGVAGTNPTFTCAADAVDDDPTGNVLVIDKVSYTIIDIKPQDDGAVVVLELRTT